ncbi:MAG: 2-C-methyl-D-erythritol 4-phosphate cytidylyltransferase [Miltoncostaeaceae bacterium]|nr:2-C-methyl-D-erythritol 4-phosphate cytidylyltransferase [Miltoncostaeaceae bacterium]
MLTVAIVVAGGAGARMGAGMPKALVPLAGRPLVSWCLEALARSERVDATLVVAPRGHRSQMQAALGRDPALGALMDVVTGGSTRSRSVLAGLRALPSGVERVLVHDAARPLLRPALADAVAEGVEGVEGAIAASPLTDTLKRAAPGDGGADLLITRTLDRAGLWRAETPQGFRLDALLAAFERAEPAEIDGATDCASLVEAMGGRVRIVPSTAPNLKVTTPADLELAELLLRAVGAAPA